MADISEWDPVDDANTDAPPNGWPEFMQPSAVNNAARAMMGAIRRWYDTVTAQLASVNTSLGTKVSKTGDTMTGPLTISSDNATFIMNRTGATAGNDIWGQALGVARWLVRVGGTMPPGNFEIHRYALDGSHLDTPLYIDWATGRAAFIGPLSVGANTAASHATPASYVDARDNAVSAAVTTYAATLDANQRSYIDAQDGALSAAINNRVLKSGDTMSGNLTVEGRAINIGPAGENMVLLNNTPANARYLQFNIGTTIVHTLTDGNISHASASGTTWVVQQNGFSFANLSNVGGHGGYADLSDVALKEQIAPAPQGLTEILQLQPKIFVRKPRFEGQVCRPELGFVAQDVQAALPLAVSEVDLGEEGKMLAVTSSAITAVMVTAIKQLNERIEVLEGRTA